MQTSELKKFENMPERIVLFNEDGSFDYANKAGADWLWGNRDDDALYDMLIGIMNSIVSDEKHRPINITLKYGLDNCKIKCSISRINGHILVVLDNDLDDKPRSYGLPSPLSEIKQALYLMSSIYVGGRPIMKQDIYAFGALHSV